MGSTADAGSCETKVIASYTTYYVLEEQSHYTHNIKELMVPILFLAIMKFSF
jgi:hypothetical protein